MRADAPDIFDVVPVDKLGMYNETAFCYNLAEPITIRCEDMNGFIEKCGLPFVEIKPYVPFVYFNSGVIVHNVKSLELHQGFTKKQISLLHQHAKRCGEQTLLNYCIIKNQQPMYYLPPCFNQMPHNRTVDYLETTWFSHYAEGLERLGAWQTGIAAVSKTVGVTPDESLTLSAPAMEDQIDFIVTVLRDGYTTVRCRLS